MKQTITDMLNEALWELEKIKKSKLLLSERINLEITKEKLKTIKILNNKFTNANP